MTVKNLSYIKINSVRPLYLITSKISGYIEGDNRNKYLTLVPTYETKEILEKYEELWNKIRDLTRSKTCNSDNCHEK